MSGWRFNIAAIFFMIAITAAFYFLILQSAIEKYRSIQKNTLTATLALQQKKLLVTANVQTTHLLAQWQHNHPRFYTAIKTTQTVDQLLQLLTQCAQQSQFSIVQAAPLTQPKGAQPPRSTQIQLTMSGNYADLFYFMNQLNNSALPFTLSQLKIQQPNQFELIVVARGFYA